ncbi:MAG: PDZ domain-containing protein, partial [Flavobacteriales bacterium]|nr:PDZ domain-containing protein [Flavobacteriales bacterium]
RILDRKEKVLFLPRVPFVIDSLVPGSGAAASTLRVGDRVIGVGGRETPYFADFQRTVRDLSGQWTFVDVERDGKRQSMLVEVSERGAIGAYN